MATILVTGGAGYIGSHMVDLLVKQQHHVIVYDNLASGHKSAVLNAPLIVADLADKIALETCFKTYKFDAVMHFAGYIQVAESKLKPDKYYDNNVINSIHLLDSMIKHDVRKLIFSSSAAVYGEPQRIPIDIAHPLNPLSPYGHTKLIFEHAMQDYALAFGLKYIALRYFNAAGCDPDARIGEAHDPETHLIPLVLQVASGRKKHVAIFGDDYPTSDGSCIRDYIHVVDLCSAHLLALDRLLNGANSNIYNLGVGKGYSVLEVIKTVEQITAKNIPIVRQKRRIGDPAILIADATCAATELSWQPRFSGLQDIVEHAWRWEQKISR